MYYTALKRVNLDEDKIVTHQNYLKEYKAELTSKCRIFLQNYCNNYCEIQPNSDEVIIKVDMTKTELYQEFIRKIKNKEDIFSLFFGLRVVLTFF